MPAFLLHYATDKALIERGFAGNLPSAAKRARLAAFDLEWIEALSRLEGDSRLTTSADQLDAFLFRHKLRQEEIFRRREAEKFEEMIPLLPFATDLVTLTEDRRRRRDSNPKEAASRLTVASKTIASLMRNLTQAQVRSTVANRASETVTALSASVKEWRDFYHSYDPVFTWWTEIPYQKLESDLAQYAEFLRHDIAGAENKDIIIGDPLGRDALVEEIKLHLVPYSPEELLAIGEREQAWCHEELIKASREMGYGDDWQAALEKVKEGYVDPGEQPRLVRELAEEAIRYVRDNDLVTVPPLCEESWRVAMMGAEEQKVSPFFLGGEVIKVSFPTQEMSHDFKLMSLRGNNRHFARATVQHELIPGHHLQMFSEVRHRPYRRMFNTPFWVEGWTLHWEMLLWELGFGVTPEDKIGMLFWRLHRCARVVFSLGFHLGTMTAEECVRLLVEDVGHEPENAAAEVRRSFGGRYSPLYQCAYLIGGLQVHQLYQEVVESGAMTPCEFHDAFLRENQMPIAVLRNHFLKNEAFDNIAGVGSDQSTQ